MSHSEVPAPPAKVQRGGPRRISDIWQWLGISGDPLGTSGTRRRNFLYAYATTAVFAGVVNILNVLTIQHDRPRLGLLEPAIWEGSSWLSLVAFFWIAWVCSLLAPLRGRPRWRWLLHIPGALAYALAHVGGFIALRKIAYWALGSRYVFGENFPYELAKDALAYGLFIGGIALVGHLLRQQQMVQIPGQTLTFDIRDGAKLTRVRLSDILAITSAGNYVEFALADGRRLLMRSPLSALESDLSGRGFVRTHRSWLVNETAVTGLEPEGSGDYGVTLGSLTAPLSRRFPAALARLRGGNPP
jgi:LytTr DNA-binding domain-containing protein